jgi:hypothetical protein
MLEVHPKTFQDAADAMQKAVDNFCHLDANTPDDGSFQLDFIGSLLKDFQTKYWLTYDSKEAARLGILKEMELTIDGLRHMAKTIKNADDMTAEDLFRKLLELDHKD